ncbi:MAG: hypothetical protein SGJ20_13900 [Planctomycetota bacterium]|nr:hypothetical protein [Planctomycetota bacterium]
MLATPATVHPTRKLWRKCLLITAGTLFAIWLAIVLCWTVPRYWAQAQVRSDARAWHEKMRASGQPRSGAMRCLVGSNYNPAWKWIIVVGATPEPFLDYSPDYTPEQVERLRFLFPESELDATFY